MKTAPYTQGVKAALDHFGASALGRGEPSIEDRIGAERFVRLLDAEKDLLRSPFPARRQNWLERPTRWSDKAPMDSGSLATQGYAGVGEYGGV